MKLVKKIVLLYIRIKLRAIAVFSKERTAEAVFEILCTPRSRSIKEEPPIFAEAEKLQLELNGIVLNGYRWNNPSGKKLLIVHGFESTVLNYENYILPLVEKNYEIIAFDAPAHGKSEGNKLSLPLFIEVIGSLNNSFGPFDAYLAHSFGGLAVTHFLEQTSHSSAMKVVLVAPVTELDTTIDKLFHLLRMGNRTRTAFNNFALQNGHHTSDWYSIKRAMPNIQAKVLWCHDEEDHLAPLKDAEPLIKKPPENIEFFITSGLGHRKIYRDNIVIKKIVEFLG